MFRVLHTIIVSQIDINDDPFEKGENYRHLQDWDRGDSFKKMYFFTVYLAKNIFLSNTNRGVHSGTYAISNNVST